MIFGFPLIVLLIYGSALESPFRGNPSLHCTFSRAGGLNDWEQLIHQVSRAAVNVSTGLEPVAPIPVECRDPGAHCAAVWTVRNNETEMLLQGCWDITRDLCSRPYVCSNGSRIFQPLRNGYPTYMCCCQSDNCNNFDSLLFHHRRSNQSYETTNREVLQRRDSRITILIWTSSLLSILIFLLAASRCYRTRRRKQHELPEELQQPFNTGQAVSSWSSQFDDDRSGTPDEESLLENQDPFLASLQLVERIGGGHFADVYRASSSMGDVAVKAYHSDQVVFENEYGNLTLLQSLENPNIIQMIHAVIAKKQLVLQLYSGSLHSLLEECSLDLTEFFDCAIAVNDGLAFLHSHTNAGVPKPVIAHRDLNPYNVLYMRQSSSRIQLYIADFGLSVSFSEGRPETNLELLTERGTVRYMAGELLEGSVNLLDPMTSLLQTDVYSCALVLWELLWRCRDIWPDDEIPSHRIAFDNLVPRNPRLEHMYPVVVRERRRPDIPTPIQKQKTLPNPTGLVELWSCITDMWEQEPEGRTTAACSADRLRRLRRILNPGGVVRDP
uniref:receptor protein serine/threonine kinase n=1 Tax=Haemonchus contortus TaxID=6289 RepID=W6NCI4_HAECO